MNELGEHIPAEVGTRVRVPDVVDVSVIIVNYNVREFLEQALRSIRRASDGLNVEVFVVDNDSADGSAAMVRSEFPEVQLIANDGNVGFGRANNQAMRLAQGRYLLILNPDTILQEDTLSELADYLDRHPEVGAAGCQILNPDGTFAPESRRAFPTPRVAFYRISGLSRLFPRSPRFGRYNMTFLPTDQESEVDALSGSCMMVRHAALYYSPEEAAARRFLNGQASGENLRRHEPAGGAGLFDEDFFMYGEDLDWCYRIQQAGWKICYTPSTRIIHYKGESTKKGELRYVRLFYGAMATFAEKHLQGRYSRAFGLAIHTSILGRALLSMVGRVARAAAVPAAEFLAVFAVVSLLGVLVLRNYEASLPALFYAGVAGGFAATYTISASLLGSYRTGRRRQLRAVWKSLGAALVLLAAVSFFIKDIAYSRSLLLMSFATSGIILSLFRLSLRKARAQGDCRVLLVGSAHEADRLQRMLKAQPDPPFILVGHVNVDPTAEETTRSARPLGPVRQLRDIVRLRNIDDVFFASRCISNQDIFRFMQQLHDLPIQFRILADGPDRVIGKASITDLTQPPLLDAAQAVRPPRSYVARRAFEIPVAAAGLSLYPLFATANLAASDGGWISRMCEKSRGLVDVLIGRKALVGFDPSLPSQPPEEWQLKPGLFALTDTVGDLSEDLGQAYWFYTQHQSASMDWDIMWKSIRSGSR